LEESSIFCFLKNDTQKNMSTKIKLKADVNFKHINSYTVAYFLGRHKKLR